MKVILQRVQRGAVRVEGETVGAIDAGFVALVGVGRQDTEAHAAQLAGKTARLRVFADDAGLMNRSLLDTGGGVLAVSQFTLYADTRKGNRPSFIRAAEPDHARALYEAYVAALRELVGETRVATGRFGAMMEVELVNDGPVTLELTTDD